MFTTLDQFIAEWENESKGTQRILEALTDESLRQAVVDGHRTLGRMAWHIVHTIPEMMSRTGLSLPALEGEHTVPESARFIAESYARASRSLVEAIRSQWNDGTLEQTRNLYGEEWTIALSLRILIQHEVHHRGQMTVLMRQAGLRVPDIYGPALEDWAKMGAPIPTV